MQKPNYYFRVVSTTLVVIAAAGAVLAMLLLLGARDALAQSADTTPPEAPTISSPANNSVSEDGNLYVSGGGQSVGDTIDLFEGENKVGTGTELLLWDCTEWSYEYDYCISSTSGLGWVVSLKGVAHGTHTYHAYATDSYGNVSGPSNTVTVVVDKTPRVIGVHPDDGKTGAALVTGVSAKFSQDMDPNTLTTASFTLVKEGSSTPLDATVRYWSPEVAERTVTLYTSADLEELTKYTATIKGGADGAKSNLGIPLANDKVWSFTTGDFDFTPPETTIDSGPSGTVNSSSAGFSFSSSESGLQFYCRLDRSTFEDDNRGAAHCGSPKEYTDLSEGSHTFAVSAIDSAGNTDASPASRTWTVDTTTPETTTPPSDTTAPETTIDSGPSGLTNDNSPTFTFSGSDDVTTTANLNYQYRVDGGDWSTPPSTTTTANLTGLSDGAHLFEVRAVDEASNEDASPAKQSFTLDATSPKVTTTDPTADATGVGRSTNVWVTLFSEALDGATVKVDTFLLGKGKLSASQLSSTTRIASNTSVSYNPGALSAKLDPYGSSTTRLARCQWYTAKVTTEVKDPSGNQLDQDGTLSGLQPKLWYFKTGGC